MMNNVYDLPIGTDNPERTLRRSLRLAEEGRFSHVIVLARNAPSEETEGKTDGLPSLSFSATSPYEILWLSRYLNNVLNNRFFNGFGDFDAEDL